MQRIFNIEKWTLIPQGKAMHFQGDRPRKVSVDVNCPTRSQLYLVLPSGKHFLALVEGRDTVEFYVNGPFGLTTLGSDCYVYTADGQGITFEAVDSESFAVIRERRARNPELEYIAALMAENMNRRLEAQAHELRRIFERRVGASQPESEASGALPDDSLAAKRADDRRETASDVATRRRGVKGAASAGSGGDPES